MLVYQRVTTSPASIFIRQNSKASSRRSTASANVATFACALLWSQVSATGLATWKMMCGTVRYAQPRKKERCLYWICISWDRSIFATSALYFKATTKWSLIKTAGFDGSRIPVGRPWQLPEDKYSSNLGYLKTIPCEIHEIQWMEEILHNFVDYYAHDIPMIFPLFTLW